jgi:hypothetical protein
MLRVFVFIILLPCCGDIQMLFVFIVQPKKPLQGVSLRPRLSARVSCVPLVGLRCSAASIPHGGAAAPPYPSAVRRDISVEPKSKTKSSPVGAAYSDDAAPERSLIHFVRRFRRFTQKRESAPSAKSAYALFNNPGSSAIKIRFAGADCPTIRPRAKLVRCQTSF